MSVKKWPEISSALQSCSQACCSFQSLARAWRKNLIYQYACSGCHNTGTQINYDKANNTFNPTWADLGGACEACHGPGSLHVNADPEDKTETIVNPARIPDPRRAAICRRSANGQPKETYTAIVSRLLAPRQPSMPAASINNRTPAMLAITIKMTVPESC